MVTYTLNSNIFREKATLKYNSAPPTNEFSKVLKNSRAVALTPAISIIAAPLAALTLPEIALLAAIGCTGAYIASRPDIQKNSTSAKMGV